jgi:hypothetical protein
VSDYPFKVGDLVYIKSSFTERLVGTGKPGVIISINEASGFFEILIKDEVRKVHKNYIIVPRVSKVHVTGGRK